MWHQLVASIIINKFRPRSPLSPFMFLFLGEEVPDSTLELVQIYFDTATFDEIQKDEKIKFDAQISLIGGTMGLLTGFSIISGVEIIFFLFKILVSLKIPKPAENS